MSRPHPPFRFQPFQRADLARASLTDGCILSWDTGLGKTIAAYTLPILKLGWNGSPPAVGGAALIVAPGGLHQQIAADGRRFFGVTPTPLDKAIFLRLRRWDEASRRWRLPDGFYLTSYTQLGRNGTEAPPDAFREPVPSLMQRLRFDWPAVQAGYEAAYAEHAKIAVEALLSGRQGEIPVGMPTPWLSLDAAARDDLARKHAQELLSAWKEGLDEGPPVADPHRLRCVWDATLSDEAMDSFDCVVVDEGTRLKGSSLQALGVLRLRPRFRYILTATPIKNRLPDFFPLAWWASGGSPVATARFPFRPGDRDDFAERFCVSMQPLDPETGKRKAGGWRRITPQVCNVHALWKLQGALVIRRRKKDSGVILPPKHRHIVRVPMDASQAQRYRAVLEDKEITPGARLTALRQVSAMGVPKHLATCSLIEQVIRRRGQVIVFSAFNSPLDAISARLLEASVPHEVLTHRLSEGARGRVAARFQRGPVTGGLPVVLAGTECMSEGYSFHLCSHVVFLDYSLAADRMRQAEDRVYRLSSPADVHSWRVLCAGSIDPALEAMDGEKGDAADLVLDGALFSGGAEELRLADVLAKCASEFADHLEVQAESAAESAWAPVRARLAEAASCWPAEPGLSRLERLRLAAVRVVADSTN